MEASEPKRSFEFCNPREVLRSLLTLIMEADRSRWSDIDLAKRADRGNLGNSLQHFAVLPEGEDQSARLAKELRKLYDVLESYAPQWYTLEYHQRAQSALRQGGKASVAVFMELCDLLEEYAPSWYTKEHYERAKSILQLLKKK